jgi:hypothetical protein
MWIFIKIWMLACNYRDSHVPKSSLKDFEISKQISHLPDFFSYMSYLFSLQSSLFGPAFSYQTYDAFINKKE